ncbi:MAG: trypsin-like peptidase domain-containing protein [FCB group bacterium]|jgi:serine protease Do|nr:trypsin-like peptidase domain-containing protein [FCB group bacterium]
MKLLRYAIVFTIAACAGMTGLAAAQDVVAPAPPAATGSAQNGVVRESSVLAQIEEQYVKLGEKIRGFVVNIDATGKLESTPGGDMENYEDLFRYFFNLPQNPQGAPRTPGGPKTPGGPESPDMPFMHRGPLRPPIASGSGFIYSKEGHIITNNHVVEGASEITVRLSNGKEYKAEMVGADPDTDVAVIKITPDSDLQTAPLGDSDQLKVGQFAIAAGSPRGLEGSVSFGHISALGRNDLNLGPALRFQNFIQTDAAINLGNSGGPLCNIHGDVVGINTAIVFNAQSLGFAVPINTAKTVIPQLMEHGKVVRGYLGVMVSDAKEFASALGMPDSDGAFVQQVQPETPAQRAGIQAEDVIRKISGKPVAGRDELVRMISELPPGATATLEVWRAGQPTNIDVKLDEYKGAEAESGAGGGLGGSVDVMGIRVRPLTAELRERLGIEDAALMGLVITDIAPGSAGAEAGLQPGDVITRVQQQDVSTVAQFRELMAQHAKPGASVLIRTISRGGDSVTRVLKVPADAPPAPQP